jgi:hypothetical protein
VCVCVCVCVCRHDMNAYAEIHQLDEAWLTKDPDMACLHKIVYCNMCILLDIHSIILYTVRCVY